MMLYNNKVKEHHQLIIYKILPLKVETHINKLNINYKIAIIEIINILYNKIYYHKN